MGHKDRTTEERLMQHSMPEPNTGCWIWMSDSVKGGYGRIRFGTKNKLAHRVSYELFNGEIPKGLEVHHKCNNPHCINPLHLSAITPRENYLLSASIAALNYKKIFCKRGHEFTPENTLTTPNRKNRRCRICTVELSKRRYMENREYYKKKAKLYLEKIKKK